MGLSYEYISSILLCAEENQSIFGFDEEEEFEKRLPVWSSGVYGDFSMGFPLPSDECVDLLLQKEVEHLPRNDYCKRLLSGSLDVSIRRDAIDWILKVHSYYKFGPLSFYLSVNYLDRFLSTYELPQGKAWMTQLLSVACLSLASKMEEMEIPLLLDLQVSEAKFVFEAKTIQRMELLLLSTLKWRMHAVTPFSFIDYFLCKINGGSSSSMVSFSHLVELILSTTKGIDFLAFRPSEIAAATVLSVINETQDIDVDRAIGSCCNVDKERVMRCYEVIQEQLFVSGAKHKDDLLSVPSVPHSPNGVLDAACLSYKSDEMTCISQAKAIPHHSSPTAKRRKITRPSIS